MATIANRELYIEEFHHGYERRQSTLKSCVATHRDIEAATAWFLIATSNRSARSRGVNGLIPATPSDLNQVSVTLAEEHDLEQLTDFKDFTGHADQRAIMVAKGADVLNRAIDDKIISTLNTATQTINSTATVLNKGHVQMAAAKLASNNVPYDDAMFAVITPAMEAALFEEDTFVNADYVSVKPYEMGLSNPASTVSMRKWMNFHWMTHTGLPGHATNSSTSFFFHRSAIGHALSKYEAAVGWDDQQAHYWARHTVYHGATILQNPGIVKFLGDDTAYTTLAA